MTSPQKLSAETDKQVVAIIRGLAMDDVHVVGDIDIGIVAVEQLQHLALGDSPHRRTIRLRPHGNRHQESGRGRLLSPQWRLA